MEHNRKVTVLHHNDADGKCSGYLAALYAADKDIMRMDDIGATFIEYNYEGLDIKDVPEESELHIVDLSFTEDSFPLFKELVKRSKSTVWIDHHKTSVDFISRNKEFEELCEKENVRYLVKSGDRSAAALAYEYYGFADTADGKTREYDDWPYYIRLISDYDTWTHKLPHSKAFNKGLMFYNTHPMSCFWNELGQYAYLKTVVDRGELISEYENIQNSKLVKSKAYVRKEDGKEILILNTPVGNSLTFGDEIKHHDAVAIFSYDGNKRRFLWSIYSDSGSEFDCSEYAKKRGGGGHFHAAGFWSDDMEFATP
jgi:oligoribonuclease NrnB/cAMP/cGMP phosphodiesterase (DHH superfamily)